MKYEIKRSWTPKPLVSSYFDQGDFWMSSNGDMLRVDGLPVPYSLNILLYLERARADIEPFLQMSLEKSCSSGWSPSVRTHDRRHDSR